ncbi:hypothetical protein [Massilia sp. DWR3-1-1]|uniref:hypothetical protein n=1 Tax=Massilia sp. DWR3-1-1 TaxID=2804559 RepID=UPI003CF9D747
MEHKAGNEQRRTAFTSAKARNESGISRKEKRESDIPLTRAQRQERFNKLPEEQKAKIRAIFADMTAPTEATLRLRKQVDEIRRLERNDDRLSSTKSSSPNLAKQSNKTNSIVLTSVPSSQLTPEQIAKNKSRDQAESGARTAAEIAKSKRNIPLGSTIKMNPCVRGTGCTSTK